MPFTIRWQNDEKDWCLIEDEASLIDAIDFFQSGEEEPGASSGCVSAPRSSSPHPKITVLIEICVDYDGPSLSKASSVIEGDLSEESPVSFLPGELQSSPQDVDAMTVRSSDTYAPQAKAKGDSSFTDNILNGASLSTEEETSAGSDRVMLNGRSSGSLTDSYPDDDLAVFSRLKLEEQPSVHDRPILETDRGKAWLQNQNQCTVQAILGVVPSTSDDISTLNGSPFPDGNTDSGISPQEDQGGNLNYNLTSPRSPESSGDLEYEVLNEDQPSKPHVPRIAPFLNSHLQTTPQTVFTSVWCPKWLQTVQNVGLSLTSSSTFARLVARSHPCPVLCLLENTTIVGIVPSMNHKGHPTHPARIAAPSHCTPPTPTFPTSAPDRY